VKKSFCIVRVDHTPSRISVTKQGTGDTSSVPRVCVAEVYPPSAVALRGGSDRARTCITSRSEPLGRMRYVFT